MGVGALKVGGGQVGVEQLDPGGVVFFDEVRLVEKLHNRAFLPKTEVGQDGERLCLCCRVRSWIRVSGQFPNRREIIPQLGILPSLLVQYLLIFLVAAGEVGVDGLGDQDPYKSDQGAHQGGVPRDRPSNAGKILS